ncbi:hypothetical protein OAR27_01785 [Alphaproteobacteria bacterium]|nr:hypothetical protein [Alphaproteobacteria bacterium]
MFRELEFQTKVFTVLEDYLDALVARLVARKKNADEVAKFKAKNPDIEILIPDFTKEAWEAMQTDGRLPESRQSIPFSPREDGIRRPVPNATLKVPTGGGYGDGYSLNQESAFLQKVKLLKKNSVHQSTRQECESAS